MQINFTYEEGAGVYEHLLKTLTADGLAIEIYFDGLDAAVISLGGSEYEVSEDGYKGLYVNFGSGMAMNIIPVASLIQQANAQIEDIVREGAIEARDWDRHVKSYSEPSL